MNNKKTKEAPQYFEYLVIGGGISGAAAAYELAEHGSVALIEAESTPGYHSTGRSAALYTLNYGGPIVRKITSSCQDFFYDPPVDFCQYPILSTRGSITIATAETEQKLQNLLDEAAQSKHTFERISVNQALLMAPILRPERVTSAAYEEHVKDIDVDMLHKSFLKGLKLRGGVVICNARIDKITRKKNHWFVHEKNQDYEAKIIVNAAGAWADEVGALAGCKPIGLVAKRRTGIVVDAPQDIDVRSMPAVEFLSCDAYLKPDAGKIMASPGDETPMQPQDVQADDWDVAVLVDRLETETYIKVKRAPHQWAGLRNFVHDENPVVGFDPIVENFFWLAGQGGYGVMMAPMLGQTTAALITKGIIPDKLKSAGVEALDISPQRLA